MFLAMNSLNSPLLPWRAGAPARLANMKNLTFLLIRKIIPLEE
jgi:hypothetical protein